MFKHSFSLIAALGLASAGYAAAQVPAGSPPGSSAPSTLKSALPPPAPRTVLPVKMVILKDGARRFTVPITIGGTTVETGLDTGSIGLRVLPGALKPGDAKSTGTRSTTRYGGGAMYEGVVAEAMVEIAGLKGRSTFQQIEKIGCVPRMPDCYAGKIPLSEYGVMGDGMAGQGFKAIMGVATKDVDVDNPLRRLGVTRFIAELPRDAAETGRLILNPEPADLTDFKVIPAYQRIPAQRALTDDTVNGCLVAEAEKKKICGALTFDSGAPGISVASPEDLGEAWPRGTKAQMLLDDASGKPLVTDEVVIGSHGDAAHLSFRQLEFIPKTVIRMGIGPYFTYSVLHSFEQGGLAVRPRKPRS